MKLGNATNSPNFFFFYVVFWFLLLQFTATKYCRNLSATSTKMAIFTLFYDLLMRANL